MTQRKIPHEIREDKEEGERKYSVSGHDWNDRAQNLSRIFNHVVADKKHFVLLNGHPYTHEYDPDLVAVSSLPIEITALRTRYYWAGKKLKGYRPSDKVKGELRTERKNGKDAYQQVVKLGGSEARTLKRGEYKRLLSDDGYNLRVYSDVIADEAETVLGKRTLKRLIQLQGQSKKLFYHPNGRQDILFEIKFDLVKGMTFDGFKKDIVEIEIELKERGKNVSEKDIEKMLNRSENVLMRAFADDLGAIYHSKVFELVQHINGWRLRDPREFNKAFECLPHDKWAVYSPS